MIILAIVCCVVFLAYPSVSKDAKEDDFEDYKEYRTLTLEEYPRSVELVFIVPYDTTAAELNDHMLQTLESLRKEVSDLFSARFLYYEAPLFYECEETPVADIRWGPQGSLSNKYNGIKPGDYSRHAIAFCYYPYDANYALTEEEWALYHKLQMYFLSEVGRPPYYTDDPNKIPDEVVAYQTAATVLGCTSEMLTDLHTKVIHWRPMDRDAVLLS